MTNILLFIALGLAVGAFSGIVGIGGGIILVPAFVFFAGMTMHQAQGTTLAVMVPPIGILAAWTYYQHGYVDIKIALLVALGFILGGLIGAKLAVILPNAILRKIFAAVLFLVGLQLLLGK